MININKLDMLNHLDDSTILLPSDVIYLCDITLLSNQSKESCIVDLLVRNLIPQPRSSMLVSLLLGDFRSLINQ